MSRFVLVGRWFGEVGDLNRVFRGVVEEPADTGLEIGHPVSVTFDMGTPTVRVTSPQAHGRYSLEGMPSTDFVLVSFLCQDRQVGGEARLEEEEQRWGGEIYRGASD
ncbi:hypothetical protein [Deinococcus hopiensis]|uniref:Uncharacterized protein n=1 Tax=Deinococcus hopiensis KR-140 TaxID=695939 RepID=A0A1W1VEE6_9DEIO|nr:hypothetical protein [Deinococcus hopiensis]SMB91807.1 hypothetical protein SAMN00790413_01304 [Deinococcus hopiensis KR-140]